MKVAVVDPSLFTLPYDDHLCRALHRRGHSVMLFTRGFRPEEAPVELEYWKSVRFYELSERPAVRRLPGPAHLALKGLEHVADMVGLLADLRKLAPDAIHFQWMPLPVVDRFFVKRLMAIGPVVMTVHDSKGLLAPSSRLQLSGFAEIVASVDRVVVHLEASKRELAAAGVPVANIAVIPHGVLGFGPGEPADDAPEPPRGADEPRRVLAFGTIKPYKGLDLLIEALALLEPELRERTRLVVAGEPHVPVEELRELARSRRVDHLVEWDLRFLPDEDVARIIRRSDVVAFPYRRIDASGVLMLALPFAKPILATRVGCFEELLVDGETARLVPPEDPGALAAGLSNLLRDPAGAEALGRRARELGEGALSWSAIADRTVALYEEAARSRRG